LVYIGFLAHKIWFVIYAILAHLLCNHVRLYKTALKSKF